MSEQIVVVDHDNVCRGGAGARYSLEFETWGQGTPQIVMLHDGLGSVAQWRHVPAAIADRSEIAVLAYNRPGHGESQPIPVGPWPTDWMSDQAALLGLALADWGIREPLLVGHSDGATIALLFAAAENPAGLQSTNRCKGVVSLAAHSFVEPICGTAISDLQSNPERMHAALAPFHRDPQAIFEAWAGVWQSVAFSSWDIRPQLNTIDVPVWVVQGDCDEYGTAEQVWTTTAAIGGNSEPTILPGLGHLLHHEDPDAIIDLVSAAWKQVSF